MLENGKEIWYTNENMVHRKWYKYGRKIDTVGMWYKNGAKMVGKLNGTYRNVTKMVGKCYKNGRKMGTKIVGKCYRNGAKMVGKLYKIAQKWLRNCTEILQRWHKNDRATVRKPYSPAAWSRWQSLCRAARSCSLQSPRSRKGPGRKGCSWGNILGGEKGGFKKPALG